MGARRRVASAENTQTDIARNLRLARLARGLTQAELAEAVDLTVESLSRAERGVILPTVRTLAKVATALGTTIDQLAGHVPSPGPVPSPGATAAEPGGIPINDRMRLAQHLARLDDSLIRRLLALIEVLPGSAIPDQPRPATKL